MQRASLQRPTALAVRVRRAASHEPRAASCCAVAEGPAPTSPLLVQPANAAARELALVQPANAAARELAPPAHVAPARSALKVVLLAACVSLLLLASPPALAAASSPSSGGALRSLVHNVLHFDKQLASFVAQHGAATYALLAGIIFCETGLVVTPFLPGDSLLFAAGALAALGSLSLPFLCITLFAAAVLGDVVNYAVGAALGSAAFVRFPRVFTPQRLSQTNKYFLKHGAKTIVLARFIPIVRTFAPFLAGVGSMPISTFAAYNISGGALWVCSLTCLGFVCGNLPAVKNNFALVSVGIILISVLPLAWEAWASSRSEPK